MFTAGCVKLTVTGDGKLVIIQLETDNVIWTSNKLGTLNFPFVTKFHFIHIVFCSAHLQICVA